MGKLFGTDGIRGIVNEELTCELAYRVGKAGAAILKSKFAQRPAILIAKDSRISGDMLFCALASGILSAGGEVWDAGVLPTPGVAHLVKRRRLTAGIMISASHNPAEYNGIKFFDNNGFKLPDSMEAQIEALAQSSAFPKTAPNEIGRIRQAADARRDYMDYLKSTLTEDLCGITLMADCANGATSHIAAQVFGELGAKVYPIHSRPNGFNINENCGSTHIEQLCRQIKTTDAQLGIAFDGDGDRVLFCDENGSVVDGDQTLAILSHHMKTAGTLHENTIVGTVMSNLGLTLYGEANGITVKQANVGDRYVLEKMLHHDYNLGGEQSGHIILSDYSTTGDGILTALMVLQILKRSRMSLSQLAGIMKKLPQILINARVKNENKDRVLCDPEVTELVETVNIRLFQKGRVLIRASGTEPLFRVMLEGENLDEITAYAHEIAALIQKKYA